MINIKLKSENIILQIFIESIINNNNKCPYNLNIIAFLLIFKNGDYILVM